MKNSCFVLIAVSLLLSSLTKAQISNVKIPGDSTVIINCIYSGLLSQTNFSHDELKSTSNLSFLNGFQVTYQPTEYLALVTADGHKSFEDGSTSYFTRYWVRIQQGNFSVDGGLVAALSTESMPSPISAAGQFMSYTEGQIPGGALGVKAKYSFGKNFVGIGVAKRKDMPEYHARISLDNFRVTMYYPEFNKKFGAAVSYDLGDFYTISVFNAGQDVGNYSSVKISKSQDLDLYWDVNHSLANKKLVKLEVGVLKNFSVNLLKGSVGMAYDNSSRAMIGYLFIHI